MTSLFRKILPLIASVLLLSGCQMASDSASFTAPIVAPLSVVSYSVLGKNPVDYGMSKYREQNCDFRNLKKYDMYCINPPPEPVEATVYCYRTLADTECSEQLDPYGNNNRPIVGGRGTHRPTYAIAADRNVGLPPVQDVPVAKAPTPLTPADNSIEDPALQGS